MFPACTVIADAERVDVGRAVALLDRRARVTSSDGCRLDLGASTLAREEGRAPPELVAARIDRRPVDGGSATEASLWLGPRGALAIDLPAGGHVVRLRAVLRGERFCLVPLAIEPALRVGVTAPRAALQATSVWGDRSIAGVARWIDVGVPSVIDTDPTHDREPLARAVDVGERSPALVIDAGPRFDAGPAEATEGTRRAALAAGGVRALSVLLGDLPLAIATAPDDASAIARLGETARAALAASRSADPLVAAVGQRLSTALANGFSGCAREAATRLPPGWPAVDPRLVATGLLADPDAGCPRLADRLRADHPELAVQREADAALAEAARTEAAALPSIASFAPPRAVVHPVRPRQVRRVQRVAVVLAALVALIVGAAGPQKSRRILSREPR